MLHSVDGLTLDWTLDTANVMQSKAVVLLVTGDINGIHCEGFSPHDHTGVFGIASAQTSGFHLFCDWDAFSGPS
jgi:hypothetical protein